MKLTVLTENLAGGRLLAEHGLSYLIEHNGKTILFDTGHSDVFLKNAEKMGIDIHDNVDAIVLSHGHWDHGDGLRFLENCTLITHPLAFIKRFRKKNNTNIGLALSKSELEQKFELITTEKPYAVTAEIIFLGEVPRGNNFESQTTTFVDESGNDDFIPDDSGIVVKLKDELVVISGCAHSGICNIIEHAVQITGTKKVKAVLGGFHLKHNNVQTQKTIEYLKQQKVEQVYPSHCTELPALSAFYESFKIQQLKTGTVLNF